MPNPRPSVDPRSRHRCRQRVFASSCVVVALTAIGAAVPASSQAEPPPCASATATTVTTAAVPYLDWAENLAFDAHGDMWVSRLYRNEVQRYDKTGRVTATVPVTSPGAIRLGPDHQLYVVYGDNSINLIPGTRGSGVVRFDPTAAAPVPEVFVSGLAMANGAAFDAAGNLYIADTGSGVVRVRPDAGIDTDWTEQAEMFGLNGLVVQGDSIYTTLYLSARGQVLRIPIDAPARPATVADLSMSDDLAAGPDGFLYVATTVGKLVRVDPGTHRVCTVLTGAPLAAVAAPPDGTRDLVVATGSGDVLRVHLPG
ncbi:SMP-30/gluconolactonase/LRE family protein [Nocardia africana]|uniref:SMP-30/gluconolactonase/LRE family protein n=1 Tax=Nocardia africana TaxID=134964 RepID=A0ABW6NI43_9NOCA